MSTAIAKKITLRGYEADIIRQVGGLIRGDQDAMIEAPTGSGKTLMARVLVRDLIGDGTIKGALIAAPQGHIEDGFSGRADQIIRWPSKAGTLTTVLNLDADDFRKARDQGGSSSGSIGAYLADADRAVALTCTHAALNRLGGSIPVPADLSGLLLVVDEAHHAPAAALSQAIELWRSRGGRLLYLTATAYRGDGRTVAPEGMVVVRRTLDQHMAEGMAPRRLIHAIEPVGRAGDTVTSAEFTGARVSTEARLINEVASRMLARWIDDGRPKTMIAVPPLRGGSATMIEAILTKFGSVGARTFDATGEAKEHQARFLEMLRSERGRSYDESEYDVIVGCGRVTEGTDWPVCSTVYRFGVPGSITSAVQLVGRAARKKPASYPLPDREITRMVFFVPTAGGEALEQLSAEQSRHALILCVFLADREAGESWIVTNEIRAGSGDAAAEIESDLDPATYAKAKAIMAATAAERDGVTPSELVEAVKARLPEVADEQLALIAVEIMAADKSSLGDRVRASIRSHAHREWKSRPEIHEDRLSIFNAILDEFRNDRLETMRSLGAIAGLAHSLTGKAIRTWVDKLAIQPFTEELVVRYAVEWWRRTRSSLAKFPRYTMRNEQIPGSGGRTWGQAEDWVYDTIWRTHPKVRGKKHNKRKIRTTIPDLLKKHVPLVYEASRHSHTQAIGDFVQDHGRLPSADEKLPPMFVQATWAQIDELARSYGKSLAILCEEVRAKEFQGLAVLDKYMTACCRNPICPCGRPKLGR